MLQQSTRLARLRIVHFFRINKVDLHKKMIYMKSWVSRLYPFTVDPRRTSSLMSQRIDPRRTGPPGHRIGFRARSPYMARCGREGERGHVTVGGGGEGGRHMRPKIAGIPWIEIGGGGRGGRRGRSCAPPPARFRRATPFLFPFVQQRPQ